MVTIFGMRQNARGARFAEQPLAQFGPFLRVGDIAQADGFDGDRAADGGIDRLKNHTHGAASEFLDDLVTADVVQLGQIIVLHRGGIMADSFRRAAIETGHP